MRLERRGCGTLRDSWLVEVPRKPPQSPDHLVLDYPVNSLAARWVWDFCGTRCCSLVLSGGL
jgi:hypothetical protein